MAQNGSFPVQLQLSHLDALIGRTFLPHFKMNYDGALGRWKWSGNNLPCVASRQSPVPQLHVPCPLPNICTNAHCVCKFDNSVVPRVESEDSVSVTG